jgi:peptide-methionine (R)-S-oxide reductase
MNRHSRILKFLVASCLAGGIFSLLAAPGISVHSSQAFADEGTAQSAEGVSEAASGNKSPKEQKYVPKTKQELRKLLSTMQFKVTQNEETEPAFRNLYWKNKQKGTYKCVVCGLDLFTSETKYRSGTGWPSFYAPANDKNLGVRKDWKLIYTRVEVHCSRCKAHLGHVFDDGPPPTGKRYCMNSSSLNFVVKEQPSDDKADAEKRE